MKTPGSTTRRITQRRDIRGASRRACRIGSGASGMASIDDFAALQHGRNVRGADNVRLRGELLVIVDLR
jgi:hypothetical protein